MSLQALRVPPAEVTAALDRIPTEVRDALEAADDAVRTYHAGQRTPRHELSHNGIRLRSFELPVERAGCYVPGGRAVYPSTVLMSATVAKVLPTRSRLPES